MQLPGFKAPKPDYGDMDDDSVARRTAEIMGKNSPLMDIARTRGLQTGNSRGLLNSSFAAGAATDEMIKAATPIATADAGIAAQKNLSKIGFANQASLNQQQQAFSAKESGLQRQFQGGQADRDRAFATVQADLDREQQQLIATWNLEAADRDSASGLLGNVNASYAAQYQAILANPDMSAEQRTAFIQQAQAERQSSQKLIQAMYSIKLPVLKPTATDPTVPPKPATPAKPKPTTPKPPANRVPQRDPGDRGP